MIMMISAEIKSARETIVRLISHYAGDHYPTNNEDLMGNQTLALSIQRQLSCRQRTGPLFIITLVIAVTFVALIICVPLPSLPQQTIHTLFPLTQYSAVNTPRGLYGCQYSLCPLEVKPWPCFWVMIVITLMYFLCECSGTNQ